MFIITILFATASKNINQMIYSITLYVIITEMRQRCFLDYQWNEKSI